jgi:hypothetical protein
MKAPRRQVPETAGISYFRKAGWLLAHNSVRPTVDQRHGWQGFRRFWIPPDEEGWRLCQCGWRPDLGPHYAITPQIESAEEEE